MLYCKFTIILQHIKKTNQVPRHFNKKTAGIMSSGSHNLVVYDKAWHHFKGNGNFPSDLPIEQAYVHMGIYLGWIVDNELYNDFFEDEAGTQIVRFHRKEISCTVLSELWDGYLGSDLFNEEGNMFTYYYYAGGIYRKDYEKLLAPGLPSIYHVKDSWENYEKMSYKITERFQEWKKLVS